jgi:hypothetical protein
MESEFQGSDLGFSAQFLRRNLIHGDADAAFASGVHAGQEGGSGALMRGRLAFARSRVGFILV